MAIVQDFEANFSQYKAAVGDAQTQLKGFVADADTAADRLATLTSDAPAGMDKLAHATKGARDETNWFGEVVNDVQRRIVGLFAVDQIAEFALHAADAGAALVSMSATTGMTVEELQQLDYIAGQTGTTLQALVGASENLALRLGRGDPGVASALDDLHISLEQFRAADPYDRLVLISQGMAGIKSETDQSRISYELFGRSWKDVQTSILANMDELGKHAQTMSKDQAQALDDAEKAWKGFYQGVVTWTGKAIAEIDKLLDAESKLRQRNVAGVTADLTQQLTTQLNNLKSPLDTTSTAFHGVVMEGDNLNRVIRESNQQIRDSIATHEAQARSLQADAEYLAKWNKAVADAMSAGDGWRGTIEHMESATVAMGKSLLAAGDPLESVRTLLHLSDTEANALAKSLAADDAALKKQTETLKLVTDTWNAYYAERASHGATALQTEQANLDKWYNDQVAAAEAAGKATGEFYDALGALYYEKQQKFLVDWKAVNDTTQKETRQGLQDTADAAQRFYQYALTQVGIWSDGTIQKARDAADAAQLAANQFGTGFAAAGDTAAAGVQKVNTALDATKQKTDAALASAIALADQYNRNMGVQAANAAAAASTGSAFGPRGGLTTGQLLGSQFGYMAARASGGPVSAGSSYLVGEQGPELFVPSSNGSIVPTGGGGVVVHNVFHLVDTESNLARRVSDLIGRSITGARRV
jgi:hypothetical protein